MSSEFGGGADAAGAGAGSNAFAGPAPFAWLGSWGDSLAEFEPNFVALGVWARPYCGGWFAEDRGVPDGVLGRFVIAFCVWFSFTMFFAYKARTSPAAHPTSASSDLFFDKDPKGDGPAALELPTGIAGGGGAARRRGAAGGLSSSLAAAASIDGIKRRGGARSTAAGGV